MLTKGKEPFTEEECEEMINKLDPKKTLEIKFEDIIKLILGSM